MLLETAADEARAKAAEGAGGVVHVTKSVYRIMSFFGRSSGCRSFSPSISRSSISTRRLIWEIGTSLAPPSKGFSVLSPTWSSDTYIQDTKALNGMTSHAIWPARRPDTPSFRRSNSRMRQKGNKAAKHQTKIVSILAYCRGYGSS